MRQIIYQRDHWKFDAVNRTTAALISGKSRALMHTPWLPGLVMRDTAAVTSSSRIISCATNLGRHTALLIRGISVRWFAVIHQ